MKRSSIPKNIERKLWSESMGYCMNPMCATDLIPLGSSIADIAHIKEHASGGSTDFDNLILLCKNCHKQIDDSRKDKTSSNSLIEKTLLKWKTERSKKTKELFEQKVTSFQELKKLLSPILQRNNSIYSSYGPSSVNSNPEDFEIWESLEPELISNNEKILLLLKNNIHLFPLINQDIIMDFENHHNEFINTRDVNSWNRKYLFPKELLVIFGFESKEERYPINNTDSLQNLLSKLDLENRLISFNISPNCFLSFINESKCEEFVSLYNGIRLAQIFWTEKSHKKNKKTNARLSDIVFVINWLVDNGFDFVFPEKYNFSKIIVNKKIKAQSFYEYEVSLQCVQNLELESDLILVNQHMWNFAPFSKAAISFTEKLGVQTLNQNEFMALCHQSRK